MLIYCPLGTPTGIRGALILCQDVHALVIKNNLVKRTFIYTAGIFVMAFGIAMTVRADIGVAPGGVLAFAASKLSPLSIGQSTSVFHIIFMLAQLAITRNPTRTLLFQFPLAYAFGFLIDLFYGLLNITISGMLPGVILLTAGMAVLSAGLRAIVGADILLMPPDALALAVGNIFGWPMSKSKLAFDIAMTALAAVLTLIIVNDAFLVVGIGTVICAAATGPAISFYTKLMPFLDVPKGNGHDGGGQS